MKVDPRRTLTRLLALCLAALSLPAVAHTSATEPDRGLAANCGAERWPVRTLQDKAGRALDLTNVTRTTARALRSMAVERGTRASRGSGVESTVYEVRARLVSATLERGDEIHLVIKGMTSAKTMIVRIPTVACSRKATMGAKRRIGSAREVLAAACAIPEKSSVTMLKGRVTIRGVGFFDVGRGQTGASPNGIEFAPVLDITDVTPPPPRPLSQTRGFASPGSRGYPDPAYNSVGVPSGTTLTPSGSITVTTAGAVIDGKDVTGDITVSANNVTIKNTRVTKNSGGCGASTCGATPSSG